MVQTVQAVPAYPHPKKVKLADGKYLTITVRGDEHGHIAMTSDNHPLYYNEQTGNYEYAQLSQGTVKGSGIVATDAEYRTATANSFLDGQDGQAIWNSVMGQRNSRMARRAATPHRMRINDTPTLGEQHPLIILVEFSDVAFTTVGDDPQAFYNRWFNEEGFTYSNGANGSARDFYVASSFGRYLPTFDVLGPVTVSKTCSYYGANRANQDQYDRIGEMIKEACTLLDDTVDFTKYDSDGDGVVDNVYIFYAGYGEADSYKSNTIWPHQYTLDDIGIDLVCDGVKINSYGCCNEINGQTTTPTVNGIGTFVHEFGHVLGLADHYDVYYGNSYTPGAFDTMDQGSYNNDGNTPPLFSAFERGELGWLEYTELNANTDTIATLPELGGSNMAYRISVEGTDGREFYVLENRQQHGWDEYLPGHGMLMWHIDIDTLTWINNEVNANSTHQRVDIVEADNRRSNSTRSGDTFPGASEVSSWTMTSWAGDSLVTLSDIEEKDETIYLLVDGAGIVIEKPEMSITEVEDSSFTLTWQTVDIANRYNVSIYNVDDDGATAIYGYSGLDFDGADTLVVEGLKPDTQYRVALTASRGKCVSDTVFADVKTKELIFEKRQTGDVAASDISEHGFTANWSAIAEAESYLLTLCEHTYNDSITEHGYDFSERSAGLPELWKADGSYVSMKNCYGEAVPSIRFSNRGGSLLVAYPHTHISSLSFWYKGGNNADCTLHVDRYNGTEWVEVTSLNPTTEASTLTVSFEQSDSVKIYTDTSNSVCYIDDVVAGCNEIVHTPVADFWQRDLGDVYTYTFDGLSPATPYGFYVRGKQGDKLSYNSEEIYVTTAATSGINSITYDGGCAPSAVYDLSGRKLSASLNGLPSGAYIVKQGGKSMKVIKR